VVELHEAKQFAQFGEPQEEVREVVTAIEPEAKATTMSACQIDEHDKEQTTASGGSNLICRLKVSHNNDKPVSFGFS